MSDIRVPQEGPFLGPFSGLLSKAASIFAITIAIWMALNAYSYTMVGAIPLIQSDAWRFLDGFLGLFIEHGFSASLLFSQVNPGDTNLPLQKLILFFHTRFYGMDFRVEGVIGTLSGILLVVATARASVVKPFKDWRGQEIWLLTALSVFVLSLNSTNVFTWPLATLWYLPILVAVGYMWTVFAADRGAGLAVVAASFLLGILLDEVSFPVFLATFGALLIARQWSARRVGLLAAFGAAGILISRLVYWAANTAVADPTGPAPSSSRSFAALVDPEIWKAAVYPLSDSVVHQSNAVSVFGPAAAACTWLIGILLIVAHLWFWWRIALAPRARHQATTATHMAAAMMLLCYGLVAGIVIQRVPVFGFDYLHQPRYVLFYELNLAALAILAYREYVQGAASRFRPLAGVALIMFVMLMAGLQLRLSHLAWSQVKYVSVYLEGASATMGKLARNPTADLECADIMTVCEFAPAKRQELMSLLVRHKLNLFSPEFQAFHRLRPYPPGDR